MKERVSRRVTYRIEEAEQDPAIVMAACAPVVYHRGRSLPHFTFGGSNKKKKNPAVQRRESSGSKKLRRRVRRGRRGANRDKSGGNGSTVSRDDQEEEDDEEDAGTSKSEGNSSTIHHRHHHQNQQHHHHNGNGRIHPHQFWTATESDALGTFYQRKHSPEPQDHDDDLEDGIEITLESSGRSVRLHRQGSFSVNREVRTDFGSAQHARMLPVGLQPSSSSSPENNGPVLFYGSYSSPRPASYARHSVRFPALDGMDTTTTTGDTSNPDILPSPKTLNMGTQHRVPLKMLRKCHSSEQLSSPKTITSQSLSAITSLLEGHPIQDEATAVQSELSKCRAEIAALERDRLRLERMLHSRRKLAQLQHFGGHGSYEAVSRDDDWDEMLTDVEGIDASATSGLDGGWGSVAIERQWDDDILLSESGGSSPIRGRKWNPLSPTQAAGTSPIGGAVEDIVSTPKSPRRNAGYRPGNNTGTSQWFKRSLLKKGKGQRQQQQQQQQSSPSNVDEDGANLVDSMPSATSSSSMTMELSLDQRQHLQRKRGLHFLAHIDGDVATDAFVAACSSRAGGPPSGEGSKGGRSGSGSSLRNGYHATAKAERNGHHGKGAMSTLALSATVSVHNGGQDIRYIALTGGGGGVGGSLSSFFVANDDDTSHWHGTLPPRLSERMKRERKNAKDSLRYLATGPGGSYYAELRSGECWWGLSCPDDEFHRVMSEWDVRRVAFGPFVYADDGGPLNDNGSGEASWIVLGQNGRSAWRNVPTRLHNKLSKRGPLKAAPCEVSLGKGDSYFVRFLDGETDYCLPAAMADVCESVESGGGIVTNIALHPDSYNYVIRHTDFDKYAVN